MSADQTNTQVFIIRLDYLRQNKNEIQNNLKDSIVDNILFFSPAAIEGEASSTPDIRELFELSNRKVTVFVATSNDTLR